MICPRWPTAINERTKIVYIANPNNPTGTMVTESELDQFINRVPENVVVALDEAYYEFLQEPPDTLKYLRNHPNVIALRTFSKIQGLAGLRIGYGLAHEELIRLLQKTRQPFNVNSISQAGALAGLQDDAYQAKTREVVWQGRDFLQAEFRQRNLEFVPSVANFILLKVGNGKQVFHQLLQRGMIVRAMDEYKLPEMDPGHRWDTRTKPQIPGRSGSSLSRRLEFLAGLQICRSIFPSLWLLTTLSPQSLLQSVKERSLSFDCRVMTHCRFLVRFLPAHSFLKSSFHAGWFSGKSTTLPEK